MAAFVGTFVLVVACGPWGFLAQPGLPRVPERTANPAQRSSGLVTVGRDPPVDSLIAFHCHRALSRSAGNLESFARMRREREVGMRLPRFLRFAYTSARHPRVLRKRAGDLIDVVPRITARLVAKSHSEVVLDDN